MALAFLDLVNDVLKRLNEVTLTPSNFDNQSNIHLDAQNAVRAAVNKLYLDAFEWPFQHRKITITCVPGQNTYPLPTDAKTVAFDTFRIKKSNALGVQGHKLAPTDYEQFLEENPEFEDEDVSSYGIPDRVMRARDLSFIVYPTPKEAYEITYEYYEYNIELEGWDDMLALPDFFRWVLHEGAMYHMYTFRGALEEAAACNTLFTEGVRDLRTLYINRYEYVRSSAIRR